jgi:hypothetical protein
MSQLSQETKQEIREYIEQNADIDDETLVSEIMTVFELDYDYESDVIFMVADGGE